MDEVQPLKSATQYRLPVQLKASATYVKGAILGPVTATPGLYALYASGNSDGSQVAECILPRAYITDASNNVFLGNTVGGEYQQVGWNTVTAYFGGLFNVADLAPADASYTTGLSAKLQKTGTVLKF